MVKVNDQKLERVEMVNELIKFIADVDMACTEKVVQCSFRLNQVKEHKITMHRLF